MPKIDFRPFPYKTVEEAVAAEGKERVYSDLVLGWQGRQYRKDRRVVEQTLSNIAKTDPRFRDLIDAKLKEELGKAVPGLKKKV